MAKLVAVTRGEPTKAKSKGHLGKYRLVATLGQGGMGTVHLAYTSGLGQFRKLLVVKELRQDLVWKDTSVSMFLDEARLAARLDHPNVVQTFEAGEDDGRYFIAMEYLDGQPLSALWERARAHTELTLPLQLYVLCEVLSGLHYAHELRDYDGSSLHVVHRDMSPQNVFITFHGQVKVVDFGVAKARNASTFTTPGVFKGKLAYAAPEQALGRPVDARADVFAVGVMLWEAIAGRRYTEQNPTPEAFQARLSGREPHIQEVVPEVDSELARICDRALALEPTERYKSAAALREALQQYLHGLGGRVDSAQLSSLMAEVFQKERVAMHRIVERAMRQEDTNSGEEIVTVPPAPMFGEGEKEMTLVADLTGLAEISHHTDEARLRSALEVSRVTSVGPAHAKATEPPPRQHSLLLWGALAVSVAAALLSIWAFYARGPVVVPAAPLQAAAPAAAPIESQATESAEPAAEPAAPKPVVEEAQANAEPAALDTGATSEQPVAAAAPAAKNTKPSTAVVSRRARTPSRPKPQAVAPVAAQAQPVAVAPKPEPAARPAAAKASEPRMGSDLSSTRRTAGARIDMEDPYR